MTAELRAPEPGTSERRREALRAALRLLLQKHAREVVERVRLDDVARRGALVPLEEFQRVEAAMLHAARMTAAALEEVLDVMTAEGPPVRQRGMP